MITRYVFQRRRPVPGQGFLSEKLQGAATYDRIAGYFDSSLLEVAGEALEAMTGTIRILCNSDINPTDVALAEQAQKLSFFKNDPEDLAKRGKDRLVRLYRLLTGQGGPKLEVRVLPDEVFGLVHGKAGVITYQNGSRTSFLGSANETLSGWNLNYELLWEDDSPEACDWVQAEFDRLWIHPDARPLAEAVIKEVQRLAERQELSLDTWKQEGEAAPAAALVVEAPVYRKEYGLWPHQQDFVQTVWAAHQSYGARFILADQVGLGKTVQLAMAAQLMALRDGLPVLALLPKTLMQQWQTELWDLLEVPSARWTGKVWIDEQGLEYQPTTKNPLLECPRRIGMISQGLVVHGGPLVHDLLDQKWSCVIVDEAHRARRSKLPKADEWGDPLTDVDSQANRLYAFLWKLAPRTRSFLMGTATPVQLHPIEAWDLLRLLAEGNPHVLGENPSHWRFPQTALPVVMGKTAPPQDVEDIWGWVKNPFPPSEESPAFKQMRVKLGLDPDRAVARESFSNLQKHLQVLATTICHNYFEKHHPFLRCIVRRTRKYLEETINPETQMPYLSPIEVVLHGESEPVILEGSARTAYQLAEDFCKMLHRRVPSAGFFKTLLLRRIGSSLQAGLNTVNSMLNYWANMDEKDEEEDPEDEELSREAPVSELTTLTFEERERLTRCAEALDTGLLDGPSGDPKWAVIQKYLLEEDWVSEGCILFSQYYDTAIWVAKQIKRLFPDQMVGIYAGSGKSGLVEINTFLRRDREEIKNLVKQGKLKILVGTDAASEGLNLQRLGTLINIDLPWNPTRLEQRKGRIQRIGQVRPRVHVLNLRYAGSVEDKVHSALSSRLESIKDLFGQIPDVLSAVWVDLALDEEAQALTLLDSIPKEHAFDIRYKDINPGRDWADCSQVLNLHQKVDELRKPWKS